MTVDAEGPPSWRDGAVERVGDGGLVALANPYRLDGRVSSHAVDTRGWAPMNVYVLREDAHALIIDSGLTAHREAILAQLATLIDSQTKVALLPFRLGELNSLCNFGPIAQRFGVSRVIGDYFGQPHEWLDFLPDAVGMDAIADAVVEPFPTTGRIAVDPGGARHVETFLPAVWLLPHAWAYDAETKTLFTQDMFSWVHRGEPKGPWVVHDDDDDETTVEDVWASLCANMYWWLPGARTDGMREDLARTFERYDVETIAPGYGCILNGRRVIERHVDLLDQVLARAAGAEAVGVEVGTWRYEGGLRAQ